MKRWRLILLSAGIIALCAALISFPQIGEQWVQYNAGMLRRVTKQVLPFFLMQSGTALLVLCIEASVVGWKHSTLHQFLHPDKSIVSDVCIFFINALQLDYVVLFVLTLGLTHKLQLGLKTAIDLKEGLLATWIPVLMLQLMFYILLVDFTMFFQHYLHHRLSFLWPFHSYHHSATELNVLTANRGHPVQSEITNFLISFVPLTLAGFPLVSLLLYKVLRNTLTFMQHSRIPWKWGWFGHHILASPGYHRIHHSILREHHDKNLAILFPLWDHLFGTFYRGNVPAQESGLPDNPYHRKNFFDDMLVPFRMFKKR